eukprot:3274904-Amphidinium_carterae.1
MSMRTRAENIAALLGQQRGPDTLWDERPDSSCTSSCRGYLSLCNCHQYTRLHAMRQHPGGPSSASLLVTFRVSTTSTAKAPSRWLNAWLAARRQAQSIDSGLTNMTRNGRGLLWKQFWASPVLNRPPGSMKKRFCLQQQRGLLQRKTALAENPAPRAVLYCAF